MYISRKFCVCRTGVLGNGDVKHEANSNRWSSSSGQTSPQELDVKARKRHRRLLEATEDAFAHVRPLYDDRGEMNDKYAGAVHNSCN